MDGVATSRSSRPVCDLMPAAGSVGDDQRIAIGVPHGVSGVDLKLGIYASDGSLLAMKDAVGFNGQELELALDPGTYYAALSSHSNYGDVGMYDLTVRAIPDGWATQDTEYDTMGRAYHWFP